MTITELMMLILKAIAIGFGIFVLVFILVFIVSLIKYLIKEIKNDGTKKNVRQKSSRK